MPPKKVHAYTVIEGILRDWWEQGYIDDFALLDTNIITGHRILSEYIVKSYDGKESRVQFIVKDAIPLKVQAEDNLKILLELWAVRV